MVHLISPLTSPISPISSGIYLVLVVLGVHPDVPEMPLGEGAIDFRIVGLDTGTVRPGLEKSTYKVRRGDNLTEIARLHQMSLRELRDLNGISGSVIHPGQHLRVRPMPGLGGQSSARKTSEGVDWSVINIPVAGVYRIQAANGPYYFAPPQASQQKSRNYFEESRISPPVGLRSP